MSTTARAAAISKGARLSPDEMRPVPPSSIYVAAWSLLGLAAAGYIAVAMIMLREPDLEEQVAAATTAEPVRTAEADIPAKSTGPDARPPVAAAPASATIAAATASTTTASATTAAATIPAQVATEPARPATDATVAARPAVTAETGEPATRSVTTTVIAPPRLLNGTTSELPPVAVPGSTAGASPVGQPARGAAVSGQPVTVTLSAPKPSEKPADLPADKSAGLRTTSAIVTGSLPTVPPAPDLSGQAQVQPQSQASAAQPPRAAAKDWTQARTTAAPERPGPVALHIGGETSLDEARAMWVISSAKAAALAGLEPRVVSTDALGSRSYRLVAGPIATRAEAAKACAELKAAGIGCRIGGLAGQPF